jgi:hypothetical protein
MATYPHHCTHGLGTDEDHRPQLRATTARGAKHPPNKKAPSAANAEGPGSIKNDTLILQLSSDLCNQAINHAGLIPKPSCLQRSVDESRPSGRFGAAPQLSQAKAPKSEPTTFLGTDNPRHLRVLQALRVRPAPRKAIDSVAGCANGPALIADLRELGLEIPCTRTKAIDRDLFTCYPGVYSFTARDKRWEAQWLHRSAMQRAGGVERVGRLETVERGQA